MPIDVKLSLVNAVADPIKAHVNCLGLLLFDGVIGDACGSAIVHLDGHWGLRMVQFNESCPEGQASLPLWKRAASSASVVLETILRKIWQRTLMVPLAGGAGSVGRGGHVGSEGQLLR